MPRAKIIDVQQVDLKLRGSLASSGREAPSHNDRRLIRIVECPCSVDLLNSIKTNPLGPLLALDHQQGRSAARDDITPEVARCSGE
jgi:hypothetical protein